MDAMLDFFEMLRMSESVVIVVIICTQQPGEVKTQKQPPCHTE